MSPSYVRGIDVLNALAGARKLQCGLSVALLALTCLGVLGFTTSVLLVYALLIAEQLAYKGTWLHSTRHIVAGRTLRLRHS